MKIVLNFVPLKSGGGIQVGLDFLSNVSTRGSRHEWFLVASQGTPFASINETANFHISAVISQSLVSRLWFETFACTKLLRDIGPDVIYTQFGPHWPGAASFPNVAGYAYSNLMYPEIDFWSGLDLRNRLVREAVDVMRRHRVRSADAVIFETEDLAKRAVRILGVPADRVYVVRPSVSSLVGPNSAHAETRARCERIPAGYRVLLLSVYSPNKNIKLLPEIAQVLLRDLGDTDTVFVVTLPDEETTTKRVLDKARQLGVSSRIYNLGPVPHIGCSEVYRAVDAVILPSQLESFSNTIAESWIMKRPLLVSDMSWARALCGDGAVYFRYNDARDAAGKLIEMKNSEEYRGAITERGRRMLAKYPSPEHRFQQYLEIIEKHAKR